MDSSPETRRSKLSLVRSVVLTVGLLCLCVVARSPYSYADGPTDLIINEVVVGPAGMESIEVFNPTANSVYLDDVTLTSGTGVFSLAGYVLPIPASDYFCLVRDVAQNAGVGTKRISVTGPLSTFTSDTLLLKRGNTVLDAVSYGTARDTSVRYTAAVAAGEFANGEFVDVSSAVDGVVLGRDAGGTDTNSLASDWKQGHSLDSFGPTPGAANSGGGLVEKAITWGFLQRVNEVLLNGFGPSVANSSHSNWSVLGNSATALYAVTLRAETGVGAPFDTSQGLTGSVTTDFSDAADGFTYHHAGTLANESVSLQMAVDEAVSLHGKTRRLTVAATLTYGGNSYQFAETCTSTVFGGPEGRSYALAKSVTDLTGAIRVADSEYTVTPTISGGDVASASGHVHSLSSYPIHTPPVWTYAAWVANGRQGETPGAITTTLTQDYDIQITRTADGEDITITNHTLVWGDGKSNEWTNEHASFTFDPATGAIAGTYSFNYVIEGVTHTFVKTLTGMAYGNGDVGLTVAIAHDGNPVASFQMHIDGFWGDLWNGVATIVTGAACTAATAFVGAKSAVITAATWGGALPAGKVATYATAGACALAINLVYDATKPN